MDKEHSGELSVGPCSRLKRGGVHTGDFGKILPKFKHHLERPLGQTRRHKRMSPGKAWKACLFFISLRTVLHGA